MVHTIKTISVLLIILFFSSCSNDDESSSQTSFIDTSVISEEFTYSPNFVDVQGVQIHYVDEGKGQPILFVHGMPTSSYLWRNIIPYGKRMGRAIALDMPGFGKSETPPDEFVGFNEQKKYLEGFINALGLENVILVLHDWGTIVGNDYAASNPDNVKAIATFEGLVGPILDTNFFRDGIPYPTPPFVSPEISQELIIEQNIFMPLFQELTVRDLTETELRNYQSPWDDIVRRKTMMQMMMDIPFQGLPIHSFEAASRFEVFLQESNIPKLSFIALPGQSTLETNGELDRLKKLKNLTLVDLGLGLHFLQEDHPHYIGIELEKWIKANNLN